MNINYIYRVWALLAVYLFRSAGLVNTRRNVVISLYLAHGSVSFAHQSGIFPYGCTRVVCEFVCVCVCV